MERRPIGAGRLVDNPISLRSVSEANDLFCARPLARMWPWIPPKLYWTLLVCGASSPVLLTRFATAQRTFPRKKSDRTHPRPTVTCCCCSLYAMYVPFSQTNVKHLLLQFAPFQLYPGRSPSVGNYIAGIGLPSVPSEPGLLRLEPLAILRLTCRLPTGATIIDYASVCLHEQPNIRSPVVQGQTKHRETMS